MEERTFSGIFLGPTESFQGIYKIFSLKMRRVVTCKHNISDIPMPAWVIRHVEVLATRDVQDQSDGNELLFIGRFSNENYFASALYEGGISVVVQDNDQYVYYYGGNTD